MGQDKPSLTSGLDAILKLRDGSFEERLYRVPVDQLIPGQFQPRKKFSKVDLEELANSIKSQGILQPLIVRGLATQQYEIIAGERRWLAAKLIGMTEVPVIIKNITDSVAAAFALVENIQRKNLNPLEEATALYRLYHEFNLSHDQIARSIGRSRVAVTNLMRLLSLNEKVKQFLFEEILSMGHARALLSLDLNQQESACDLIMKHALSVRQTEELVRKILSQPVKNTSVMSFDPQIQHWQQQLTEYFDMKLTIKEISHGQYHLTLKAASKAEIENLIFRLKN